MKALPAQPSLKEKSITTLTRKTLIRTSVPAVLVLVTLCCALIGRRSREGARSTLPTSGHGKSIVLMGGQD